MDKIKYKKTISKKALDMGEIRISRSPRYITETESICIKPLPELFDSVKNCCGCSACYAICPVRAISMDPDEEGFLYPTVDTNKCIRCYQCISICVFKIDQERKGYCTPRKGSNN